MATPEEHLAFAIKLAVENMQMQNGRPFGAVLVKDEQVVATGVNCIHSSHDPTAHAELQAIRAAAQAQRNPQLDGHAMYASGYPCPMCLAVMYLVGIRQAYYAYSLEDGEPFGLSTADLYAELAKPLSAQSMRLEYRPVRPEGLDLYAAWRQISAGA